MPLTWQALPRLMRELGPARTKELAMACERFTSAQALQGGFLNHVVPAAEVLGEARRLAERLLSMATPNMARTKSDCPALADPLIPTGTSWKDATLKQLRH